MLDLFACDVNLLAIASHIADEVRWLACQPVVQCSRGSRMLQDYNLVKPIVVKLCCHSMSSSGAVQQQACKYIAGSVGALSPEEFHNRKS
jgi:hypothetical protein